jgi:DNA-binding NtrC family response regulator
MPSLHERTDDIPLLVEYFIGRFEKKIGHGPAISESFKM